jgi:phage shock protein A
MSEGHAETLSDLLNRIRKLEEEARASHDREIFLDENRENLRKRVQTLEGTIHRLEQDIRMIQFNRRHNR